MLWRGYVLVAMIAAILIGSTGGVHAEQVAAPAVPAQPIVLTHGIASGDVTAFSAIIWTRASGAAHVQVDYDTDPLFTQPQSNWAIVSEATDFTVALRLDRLVPDTVYHYRVGVVGDPNPLVGTFRTAPDLTISRPVSFVWGGDLGGQHYCRRVDQGYAIFAAMQRLAPDFFIANGDMIYADFPCPADGPDGPGGWQNIPGDFPSIADPAVDWTDLATVRDIYLRHWRYNRADPHMQGLLQRTPMYAQWDDHEVINDAGWSWSYWNAATIDRPGYPNLVAAGREAFFDYAPLERNAADPNRIYRAFNWGRDLDLILLDARSYRSRNDLPDTPEVPPKTLLGPAQLLWLKQSLVHSQATWKVISSDVPLSIPGGYNAAVFGRDGWANGTAPNFSAQTGFERELLDLLRFVDDHNIVNVVFVTTDVHFAQTIHYETDANGDGDTITFYEVVSGPLSAAPFRPVALDPTLNPTSLYSESGLFNFGYLQIQPGVDGQMHLIADVRGENGQPRPGSRIDLRPYSAP